MSFPRSLIAAAVLAVVVALLTGQNIPHYYRLSRDGVVSKAVVVSTMCERHKTFKYQYESSKGKLDAVSNDGYGNPWCENLKRGDLVTISYLPLDPSETEAGNPNERLTNEIATSVLATVLLPLFFVLIQMQRRRRHASSA